jgi:Leucine-rich repeat (LRR) protein
MRYCNTSFIPNVIYKTFKNLAYLAIFETSLANLQPDFFDGAKKLKYFSLSQSKVTELKAGVFTKASNLKYIDLSGNWIRFIHKNSFDGLTELSEIDLRFNRVQMVHYRTFSGLESLDRLLLKNSDVKACIIEDFIFTGNDKKLIYYYYYHQAIETGLKACHDNYVDEMMDRGLTAYELTLEYWKLIDRFEIETKDIVELQRKMYDFEKQTYDKIEEIQEKVSISTILISVGCCFVISILFIVGAVFYLRYVLKNSMIHLANRVLTQSELHYNHYDNLWRAKFPDPDANSLKLDNTAISHNKPIATVSEQISKVKDEITEMKRIMNIF